MPVQEFECQIARSQIGRYLNGEGLSSEGLRQLGAHVAECTNCKGFLDHRKAALQGMLGEAPMPPREEEVRAVVDLKPADALLAQLKAKTTFAEEAAPAAPVAETPAPVAAAPVAKPVITKPVLYCGALAVVLIAMTYISRNPTSLLGPKANANLVADNSTKPTQPISTDKPADKTADKPTDKAADKPADKPADTKTDAKPEAPAPTKPEAKTEPTGDADPTSNVAIAPAGKTDKSPLALDAADTEQSEATDTPVTPTVAPKHVTAKPHAKVRGHARTGHLARRGKWRRRSSSYLHLKAGSAAIHVYAN